MTKSTSIQKRQTCNVKSKRSSENTNVGIKIRKNQLLSFHFVYHLICLTVLGVSLAACFLSMGMTSITGSMHDGSLLHIRMLQVETPALPHIFPRIVFLVNNFADLEKVHAGVENRNQEDEEIGRLDRRFYVHTSERIDKSISTQHDRPIEESITLHEPELKLWPEHEFDSHCKPMAEWQSMYNPTCNQVHENDFLHGGLANSKRGSTTTLLSSSGFWRLAWSYTEFFPHPTTTVWKTFKYVCCGTFYSS
jgi:hypothetical protein